MDRCSCMMSEVLGGRIYCAYYDIGVRLCEEIPDWDCPEMDEEDEDDDDIYGNDEEQNAFNRELIWIN